LANQYMDVHKQDIVTDSYLVVPPIVEIQTSVSHTDHNSNFVAMTAPAR